MTRAILIELLTHSSPAAPRADNLLPSLLAPSLQSAPASSTSCATGYASASLQASLAMDNLTLSFCAPVKLKARTSISGKTRGFTGIAYTGGVMYPTITLGDGSRIYGPVVLDLDGLTIPSEVCPVLDDHDDSADGTIGQTSMLARRGNQLLAKGVIYARAERAQPILQKNDSGRIWQLSVGTDIHQIERVPPGKLAAANGQTFIGPITIVRKSLLNDLSFVERGADDKTSATIAARRSITAHVVQHTPAPPATPGHLSAKGSEMDFDQWLNENFSLTTAALEPAQLTKFQKLFADAQALSAKPTPTPATGTVNASLATTGTLLASNPNPAPTLPAVPRGGDGSSLMGDMEAARNSLQQAMREETIRQNNIGRLCAGRDSNPAIMAIYEKAINTSEMSIAEVELAVMRAGRPAATRPDSQEEDDKLPMILEAALAASTGMKQARLLAHYGQDILTVATSKRYRGITIQQVADVAIRRAGLHFDCMRGETGHMQAARDANAKLTAAGFTSFTVSNILENVAHKFLLDAYAAVQTFWQTFCAIQSNTDFKAHSRYALDFTNTFQKVGPQGDLPQLQMTDRKYTTQLDTFGARFAIDRQTWKNDDLGAIQNRLSGVGMQGAKTIEMVVHQTLLAAIGSFFAAANGNYLKGATAALTIDGLTLAETTIGNQVGLDKQPLGVEFDTLMVGLPLKQKAGQIYTSTYLNEIYDAGNNGTRKGQAANANPFINKYKPVANPYLSNKAIKQVDGTALSNQDDGLWMMFGQQGNNAAVNVAFLNGAQAPTVETIANTAEILGFELAAFIDFGVGFGDPRLALCCNPADVS